MNSTNISFSDLNSKLEGASNLSISTLGKSMKRVGLETATSPSTSRSEGALGPLVGSQKTGYSVQVEVMDQSLGDLAVKGEGIRFFMFFSRIFFRDIVKNTLFCKWSS